MGYLKVNLYLYLIRSLHIAVVVEHHLVIDILMSNNFKKVLNEYIILFFYDFYKLFEIQEIL